MPISYMGTKRHLAPTVRSAIDALSPKLPVLDLFGGMGSVTEALAPDFPVLCNDFLGFASAIARARLATSAPSSAAVLSTIEPAFANSRAFLKERYGRRLAKEATAISSGGSGLAQWMEEAPTAATSVHFARKSRIARASVGTSHYQLATLYFSAGYFSTRQAIELDALRCAIEGSYSRASRGKTVALAAWLVTASRIANSPGHTAQFLRPNSPAAFNRIRSTFARSVWRTFAQSLQEDVSPLGTPAWRSQSGVVTSDAVRLLQTTKRPIGAVYADPPYSRDQYARFYHVQETLYRYDYPGAYGRGRGPCAIRPSSSFSRASEVESAFADLFMNVARRRSPLILSYPSEGLLHSRGIDPVDLGQKWLDLTDERTIPHKHSTLGASHGSARGDVFEKIYTFIPRKR